MADRTQIRRLLLTQFRDAAAQMKRIRDEVPLSYETLRSALREYVRIKYLLNEEDMPADDDFNALAEISLARSMQIDRSLVAEFDTAQSCDGATSVMAKKVLLFMAIQRELNILLPAMASARLKTLDGLCELTWEAMEQSDGWKDKLKER